MTERPRRIQLSRKKGSRLQAESLALNGLPAARVTRPGRWGNPFTVDAWADELGREIATRDEAVDLFVRFTCSNEDYRARVREGLAGRNLACHCKANETCHADVLLAIANGA